MTVEAMEARGSEARDRSLSVGGWPGSTRGPSSTEGWLEAAYHQHAGAVFKVACAVSGSRTTAEEITQDVFVALWRNPAIYDPLRGSLRGLLCSIARFRAIDYLRSRRAQAWVVLDDMADLAGGLDPADDAIRSCEGSAARAAVDALPVPQRDAIVLAFFGGLSYREVASITSIPEGTIKSRIRLALNALGPALERR